MKPLPAALFFASLAMPALADEGRPFALRDGDRVVFFGDSITQADHYVAFIEAYLLTRFPDRRCEILNHGISSETISGTSEPDHDPRRPDAHDRFDRDVAAWKPDVVVACFGMNDGNYFPFDEGRFARYRDGVRRLIDRTRGIGARLVLLTPPPFDPYRRQVGDPSAKEYGYKFPAINYDATLARYAAWLVTLREEGIEVIDLHTALNDHLRRRREGEVSFHLAADAVHPGETGHWLMAQAILLALGAPATVAEARIDTRTLRVEAGEVRGLEREGDRLRFAWTRPLPAPIPLDCDRRSLVLERTADRLNRDRLVVTGLPAGRYRLSARAEGDWVEFAGCDEAELASGIDLAGLEGFPSVVTSGRLLKTLRDLRRDEYDQWRAGIAPGGDGTMSAEQRARSETAREALRELSRPGALEIAIEPASAELSARRMHNDSPLRGERQRPVAGTTGPGFRPRRGIFRCRSRSRARSSLAGRNGRPR